VASRDDLASLAACRECIFNSDSPSTHKTNFTSYLKLDIPIMPEPVSLSASIIGLVGACAKLSITFYELSDTIISARQEIAVLANEISVFSQCLTMFSKVVDRSLSEAEGFKEIAEKLIESIRSAIIETAEVVNGIAPQWLSDDPESTLKFGGRLKWLFQRSKVNALRSKVESFKTTLLFLISVVDYAEARGNNAPKMIQ